MNEVNVAMHVLLGDFICAEPALRAICKKHEGSRIIVSTPFKDFLAWYPYPLEVRQLNGPPDYRLICDGNAHLVRRVAEDYGLFLESELPDLNIPVKIEKREPYYLVCTEASVQYRQWAQEKWEEVIKSLDAPVVQVGRWGKLPLAGADTSLLGKPLQPDHLASLIAGSKCFLTVDTGLSHLSASLRKPYIVLMDRVPVAWRMHAGFTHPIKKNCIDEITVDDVLKETAKYLGQHH